MSHISTSDLAIPKVAYPTLAQLRERILTNEALPLRRRQDIASACRSLGKALGKPLEAIVAEPCQLRLALKGYTPAMARMTPGRWRNILSLVRHALSHAGLTSVPARFQIKPSTAWAGSLAQLSLYGDRYVLARFARYCTNAKIDPDQVDDVVLVTYLSDLERQSLVHDPARTQRETAVKWNRAASSLPAWPQQRLVVADNRKHYAKPWASFPASLQADVQAWLDWLGGSDPLAGQDFAPLRATSLRTRKGQMHEYLSALVLQGEDPANMLDLAAVVTVAQARKALRFFWNRAGGKPSVHGGQVAGVIASVARHWAKLPDTEVVQLKTMAKRMALHQASMTSQNRQRLGAVNPDRLQALLMLPERIRREVVRDKTPAPHLAQRLQTAVAIELLTMAPVRLLNLAKLQIGVNLLFGRHGEMTLSFAEHEVKNSVAMEIVLPPPTARLLDLYIKTYRPLLGQPNSAWLFPGQLIGKHKSLGGMRQQIEQAIADRCGLVFNPHLFRHLAAKLILEANPGAHGQVQRILGHKSVNTALTYYSGLETSAAVVLAQDHPSGWPLIWIPSWKRRRRRCATRAGSAGHYRNGQRPTAPPGSAPVARAISWRRVVTRPTGALPPSAP